MKSKIIIVSIVIAGIAVAYVVFGKSSDVAVTAPEPTDIVETQTVAAGDFVVIPKVVLSKPGFVMIHESENGNTGSIVMTGDYLASGVHTDVVVKTGNTTAPGEHYFAMLHYDDGNGVYDSPAIDPPVVFGNAIVQSEFAIE